MSITRRHFLAAGAGAGLGAGVLGLHRLVAGAPAPARVPEWNRAAHRKGARSRVAVLPAAGYDAPLTDVLLRGIAQFDLPIRGKRVVLKPNLVELDRGGVVNTNAAVVLAAVEAFRTLGAREVIVAEGPGHRRDNQYILVASGVYDVLKESRTRYVDLNTDAVRRVRLNSSFTDLGSLYLPETVLGADLLVSMPKMKTHHWAGATLSLKNMFGVVPSAVYGWPKNVLHWAGIDQSIIDINAALEMPRFNIVDGIIGMEGNGPIQGSARHSGVIVCGTDPVAVDATCARLMQLDPWRIRYLHLTEPFLGNVAEERIEQTGEDPGRLSQDYQVLPQFRHLKPGSLARGA